jgi:hypothetical protein
VAHGEVESSYRQADPRRVNGYDERDRACAVARWFAAGTELPGSQEEFAGVLDTIAAGAPDALPTSPNGGYQDLAEHYDADRCRQHERVQPGLAWGGLFVRPELLVRVGKQLNVGAFSRTQVVTGSNVVRDDPYFTLSQSYAQDVTSPDPKGARRRPPTSWTLGLEVKYFLSRGRLRPFVGAFTGYGRARLRVPMQMANDRNGNSVPDDRERASATVSDINGDGSSRCVAVWPYDDGCTDGAAAQLPSAVVANAGGDRRVDTVALGPWFVGALAGLHVQLVDHFALTTELRAGFWFPSTASLLVDISAGPAFTF